jgi:hypothetical protein
VTHASAGSGAGALLDVGGATEPGCARCVVAAGGARWRAALVAVTAAVRLTVAVRCLRQRSRRRSPKEAG